jgi:hypothetical protein
MEHLTSSPPMSLDEGGIAAVQLERAGVRLVGGSNCALSQTSGNFRMIGGQTETVASDWRPFLTLPCR